ncbi:SMC-Scp complex subunit ScpB [Candidatus Woesearchaeota archaeon]|nr:SMC-Scp complex subunit ScpB [Candidatus Woesearchaeota archaeon]
MSDKKKVEAVLFSIGKEVSLVRLSELCDLSEDKIKKILEELKEEYGERDHSLSVVQRGDNYKLTVKDEFIPIVSKLVEGMDLDKALMETLAVIAWKYPVVQSEVIKLRNNKAYEHIKRLMELEFVEKERFGRTFKLKLTKKFFEYFDLPSAEAKKAFLDKVPQGVLKNAEDVDKEADVVEKLVEQDKKERVAKEEISSAMEEAKKVQEKVKESKEEETESTEEESKEETDATEGVKLLFGE